MKIGVMIRRAGGHISRALRNNKSTFISIAGVIGVGVTAVLAVKGAEEFRDEASTFEWNEKTPTEKCVSIAKHFGPSVASGVLTSVCIFKVNAICKESQGMLVALGAGAWESVNRIREKVNDIYGESAFDEVERRIAADKYHEKDPSDILTCLEDEIEEEDKRLFYLNDGTDQNIWFYATPEHVAECGYKFENLLYKRGWAEESELIDMYLYGENEDDLGSGYGWNCHSGYSGVDFNYELVVGDSKDDVPPFYRIILGVKPHADFLH